MRKALAVFVLLIFMFRCSGTTTKQLPISAGHPVHLEEYLNQAEVRGSEVPKNLKAAAVWRFDVPQPDWKTIPPLRKSDKSVQTVQKYD